MIVHKIHSTSPLTTHHSPLTTHHSPLASPEKASPVEAGLALSRHADDEIVARHVRKAAKVHDVLEFFSARSMRLVAAGRHAKGVADEDRLRCALPEIELVDAGDRAMHLYFDGEARIG